MHLSLYEIWSHPGNKINIIPGKAYNTKQTKYKSELLFFEYPRIAQMLLAAEQITLLKCSTLYA